eukprot:gnl/MRDRNA2_/MRDRNA2_101963_c0_seq1.p1 gnl/MRDRNA2_/MRDRNA2_101963_c0~~gnl/MRDRNA2_/MRDRNA2_101963_c0_seq1.p1  ORF type:complete len:272 (+),score=35.57 gnl/MRDRNA2_/MRDRNA2_101963_c0_seq1:65-880(+)
MPPPPKGRLHYPTALALPPDSDTTTRATEQMEGVRIDRKAFRPLRRKKNAAASEVASTTDTFEHADGAGSTPSSSFMTADWCSQSGPGMHSDFMGYNDGYNMEAPREEENSYLDGDRSRSDHMWYNDESRFLESEGEYRHDPGFYSAGVLESGAHSMWSPSRGGYPVSGERSTLNSSMRRSQSFGSVTRRSPLLPKQDRMNRGAQMRDAWSRDRFLRNTNCRKFDLRGCGSGATLFHKPMNSPHIPGYVPPHQKRRDSLRMEVRQQMLEVA